MPAGQNILEFGLDISSFNQQKMQVLNEFIALFNKLEQYDGKKITPVLGEGMAAFDKSIKETSASLNDINKSILDLNKNIANLASSQQKASSTTKAQAKELSDLEKLKKKSAELDSQEAKEIAKLKAEIEQKNKALKESAESENELYQARKKAAEERRKEIENEKKTLAQQKAAAKEAEKAERERAKAVEKASRDAEAARKREAREAEKSLRSQAAEAKRLQKEQEMASNKMMQLQELVKKQRQTYANLKLTEGADSEKTAQALEAVRGTQSQIDSLNNSMNTTEGKTNKALVAMQKGYSFLLRFAYIIPGLGIAGIFNVIFESIGFVIDQLGLLDNAFEKSSKIYDAQAKATKNLIDQYFQLFSIFKDMRQLGEGSSGFLGNLLTVKEAEGYDKITIAIQSIGVASKKLEEAKKTIAPVIGKGVDEFTLDDVNKELAKRAEKLSALSQFKAQIERLPEQAAADRKNLNIVQRIFKPQLSEESIKEQLERTNRDIEIEQKKYDQLKKFADDYVSARVDLEAQLAAKEKLIFDQRAERQKQFIESSVEINKKMNEIILEDEISSEKQRDAAIVALRKQTEKELKAELDIVLNDIGKTSYEKDMAKLRYDEKMTILSLETEKKRQDLRVSYAERANQADATIKTSQLEAEAQYSNKILNDTKATLSERLAAYTKYVTKKEQIQKIELEKDLKQRKLLADDPTVKKERDALTAQTNQQIDELYAGGEGEFYRIFSEYSRVILDESKDLAEKLRENGNEEYAKNLEALNAHYEDRKISYINYKRSMESLQKAEARKQLKTEVKNEEMIFEGLVKSYATKIAPKLAAAKEELAIAEGREKAGTAGKGEVDRARGKFRGLSDESRNFESTINAQRTRVNNARRRLADAGFADIEAEKRKELSLRLEWIAAIKQVEASLVDYLTEMKDQELQEDLRRIEERKRAMEEMYEYERNAIEKSSLSAKEKNALDVQLNAKKLENEKALQREQKKLAHDKAVFDKEIAIANIIFNTAAAVVSLLENPILATAAGIAGAIQLAKAIQTKIPEYKYGTENHPGGLARIGEAGMEIVKEPNKAPYAVKEDTYTVLPKGTKVIPSHKIGADSVPIRYSLGIKQDDDWDKFVWLAKQIKPKKSRINNKINVNINLGFENYKKSILDG